MQACRAVASEVTYTVRTDLGRAIEPMVDLTKTLGKVFSPLHKSEPCLEATRRAAVVILSPLCYVACAIVAPIVLVVAVAARTLQLLRFTVRFCLNKNKKTFLKDWSLGLQIKVLKRDKPAKWEDTAITLIRKSRYASPDEELQRLRTVGVLTPQREAAINYSHTKINLTSKDVVPFRIVDARKLQFKVLKAQAMEIADTLHAASYDVLLSAQATQWEVISHVVKECIRAFEPQKKDKLKHFKFLRAPCETVDIGFMTNIFNFFIGLVSTPKEPPKNVQGYLSRKREINDDDLKTRAELLSADAYYNNYTAWESNTFFGINNINVLTNTDLIKKLSKKLFKHFCPKASKEDISFFAEEIQKISQEYTTAQAQRCGNLFVICVPRAKSPEILYRAHPFGAPCGCNKVSDADIKNSESVAGLQRSVTNAQLRQDQRTLVLLQANTHSLELPESQRCQIKAEKMPPQYRLYTPMLTPEHGVKSFMLTPVPKPERQAFKAQIKAIVKSLQGKQKPVESKSLV
ncbi:MAG: hypothetical protein H0X51_01485 [Parachlamydiaceae bacterium]|nr:hypothetical protein [Parachlamydiaceae bacterium]